VTKIPGGVVEYLESSAQADQLKAIGAKLLQERQAKSVSLEEVATKTYIPLRLLSAIEAGRLDLLPEPVFIQGFIRRYADIIGLDGVVLSKEFSVQPPVPVTVEELPPEEPSKSEAMMEFALSKPFGQPNWQYLVGGAIGLGAIWLIIASLAHRPKVATSPAPSSPVVTRPLSPKAVSKSANPVAPAASPVPSIAPSVPTATSPVQVNVKLSDESWMEVRVDGAIAFEGTLQKGTQRSWSGQKQVVISAGNAGGVSASYNNGAAKPLGAPGDIAQVSFPPSAPGERN
jgi:cytoskeleton protein RodZ